MRAPSVWDQQPVQVAVSSLGHMDDREDLTRELADIQDELLGLADDDFAAKFHLHRRRDEVRDRLRGLAADLDDKRSDEELIRELAAQRAQLEALESQQINMTSQSLAGMQGGTFSASERAIADRLTASLGIDDVHRRIAHLKRRLDGRHVTYPD